MSKLPSLSGGQLSLDLFLISKTRNVKENVAPPTSSKRKRLLKDDDEYDDRPFKKDKEQKKVQVPRGEERGDRSTPLLHSRTVGGLQTPLSYGDTPMAKSKNKSTTKVAHTVQPAPFPLPSPPQITASELAHMRRNFLASEQARFNIASTSKSGTLYTPSPPRRKRRRRDSSSTSPVKRGLTFSRRHRAPFTPESERVVPSSQPSLDGRNGDSSEDPFTDSRLRLSSRPFDFDMLPSPSIPSSTYESSIPQTGHFKVPLSPWRLDLGQDVRRLSTTDEQKNDDAESPVRWNEETIPSSQSQYLVMRSSPIRPTKPPALQIPQHHSDDIVPTSQSQEQELILPKEGDHFVSSHSQAQSINVEQSGHTSSLSSPLSPCSLSGDFKPFRRRIKPPPQLVEQPSRIASAGVSQPDSQLQHCSFDSSQTEPDSQAISYYYPSQAHSPVSQLHTPLQAISFNGVPIQRVGAVSRKNQSMHAVELVGGWKEKDKYNEPVSDEESAEIDPTRCSTKSPSETANPKLDTVTSPVRRQPDLHVSVRDDLPNSQATNPSRPAVFCIPRKMATKMADIIDRLDAMTSQELEGSFSFSDVSSGGSMLEFESLPSVLGDLINGSNQDLSDVDHTSRDG